jgi:hypothetical protein
MEKYGSSCVRIADPVEFERRLLFAMIKRDRLTPLGKPLLTAGPVIYFDTAKSAPESVDVKNPRHVPFLKRSRYSTDAEYRYLFARRGGFILKQMIVIDHREEDDDLPHRPSKALSLEIGSIRDIAAEIDLGRTAVSPHAASLTVNV